MPPMMQDVVGPVCETGDYLALDRKLPPFEPGDLVAFMTAGAYGAAMSSTYNTRLLVPEVLVDGAATPSCARARATTSSIGSTACRIGSAELASYVPCVRLAQSVDTEPRRAWLEVKPKRDIVLIWLSSGSKAKLADFADGLAFDDLEAAILRAAQATPERHAAVDLLRQEVR